MNRAWIIPSPFFMRYINMFEYIILISSFLIAACAAFFSVTGIAQLFAGATISAGIMAAALELGKLVSVSFLYRHWKSIPKTLKSYMLVGSFILMLLTSMGIYGYLSAAYATSASSIQQKEAQTLVYTKQQQTIQKTIDRYTTRISSLENIRAQQETRLDNLVNKNRSLNSQQSVIRQSDLDIKQLNKDVANLYAQSDSLELLKINTLNSISTEGKLGTFYYVAKTLNVSLDTIVKWFILAIVFVFDPLSVSLILSYNFLRSNHTRTPSYITDSPVFITPSSTNTTSVPTSNIATHESEDWISTKDIVEKSKQAISHDVNLYYRDPAYNWDADDKWKTDPQAIEWKRNLA